MCPQPTSEGINNLGCFLDKMKWHEMKRGSKLMMTWVTIVPEHEVSDAAEIFYPLPLLLRSIAFRKSLTCFMQRLTVWLGKLFSCHWNSSSCSQPWCHLPCWYPTASGLCLSSTYWAIGVVQLLVKIMHLDILPRGMNCIVSLSYGKSCFFSVKQLFNSVKE